MAIVGYPQRRGWPAVRHTLAKLFSPTCMLRSDAAYVKAFLAEAAALQAADDASRSDDSGGGGSGSGGAGALEPAPTADAAGGKERQAEEADAAPLMGGKSRVSASSAGPLADDAVLPWWLPPEQVPAQYSGASGCGSGWAGAEAASMPVWPAWSGGPTKQPAAHSG